MPNAFALLAISAECARKFSAGVAWTPKPEEPELEGYAALPNEFHGEIIGKLSRSDTRNLAANAKLIWIKNELDLGPFQGQSPAIG